MIKVAMMPLSRLGYLATNCGASGDLIACWWRDIRSILGKRTMPRFVFDPLGCDSALLAPACGRKMREMSCVLVAGVKDAKQTRGSKVDSRKVVSRTAMTSQKKKIRYHQVSPHRTRRPCRIMYQEYIFDELSKVDIVAAAVAVVP
jgi:hypothetical protein